MEYKVNQKREILLTLIGTTKDLIEIFGSDEEDKKVVEETYNEIDDLPEKVIEELWDSGLTVLTKTINYLFGVASSIGACLALRESFRAIEKEIEKHIGVDSKKGQA